eukprot:250025_1
MLVGGGSRVILEDLGSTNGTFVNGVCIKRATLSDGDTVVFGGRANASIGQSLPERPSVPFVAFRFKRRARVRGDGDGNTIVPGNFAEPLPTGKRVREEEEEDEGLDSSSICDEEEEEDEGLDSSSICDEEEEEDE